MLWRRLDAAFADPLELDAASRLGTPGLVGALRQGSVTLVNALGSGILETRALLAFSRIAEALTGAPLILPNIATWWCGQPSERDHVRANKDRMMIGPALSTRLYETEDTTVLGSQFRAKARASFDNWLEADGAELVGQETVTLSTTPPGKTASCPRPMSLRVFLARTPQGWQIMQGGFTRIGNAPEASAIAMQRGGTAADVWVISRRLVETVTMLPTTTTPYMPACAPACSQPRRRQPLLARPLRRTRRRRDAADARLSHPPRRDRRPRRALIANSPTTSKPMASTRRRRPPSSSACSTARSSPPATSATASPSTAGWR